MKKLFAALLALLLTLSALAALANEKLVIGTVTPGPHEIILEAIKEDLAKLGYDLEITRLTAYPLPNPATSAGDMAANYFQHIPYLNDYNKDLPAEKQLVPVIGVHYEPYGIYAGTKKDLKELAKGDKIAVTNDPSNETRALKLLADAKIITLKDGDSLTKESILDNPHGIEVVEMDAERIPSVLPDVAFAVINGNFAIGAGLSPAKDALFLEPKEGDAGKTYTNYIVVRPEDKDAKWVHALQQVIFTQKLKDYILNYQDFKGGVIPVFEVPAQ